MNKTSIFTLLVVLVLVVIGILVFGGESQTEPSPADTPSDQVATTTQSTSTSSADATTTPPSATTQDETPTADNTTPTPSDQQSSEATPDTQTNSSQTVTVTYTESGFSPQTVEVTQGDTVRFVNESGADMWVGSDRHPAHTQYAGTSLREHCPERSDEAFDQCEAGDTYNFTFDKAGSWSYHNHLQASDGGTVVVE